MIPHTISILANEKTLSIVALVKTEDNEANLPLLSFLSRDELHAALGRGKEGSKRQKSFQALMEKRWPWAEFNWSQIAKELEKKADILPLRGEFQTWRLDRPFQNGIDGFARQILQIPTELDEVSRDLLVAHRDTLDFLINVADHQLNQAENSSNNSDKSEKKEKKEKKSATETDPFLWSRQLNPDPIPKEIEERVAELYERGAYEAAWKIFSLLVRVFPDYTDGYNFLGLIRLEEERFDEARAFFELAVAAGRRRLPRTLKKTDWNDERQTSPYLRALRNLALVCERSERYEQALEVCEHLRSECQDFDSADSYAATTYLRMKRWPEARATAARLIEVLPEFGVVASIAAVQEGKEKDAGEYLAEAARETPRVVAECFGIRLPRPKSPEDREEQDYAEDFADDVAPAIEALPMLKRSVLTGIARELVIGSRQRRQVSRRNDI
jgi:tetratricopeptide (TPR) repeat protein